MTENESEWHLSVKVLTVWEPSKEKQIHLHTACKSSPAVIYIHCYKFLAGVTVLYLEVISEILRKKLA